MFRKCVVLLLLVVLLLGAVSCGGGTQSAAGGKLRVAASFDAMREFVAAVGCGLVEVTTIIPAGVEPHAFEPKAGDVTALRDADVFVYNGFGMEAWAEEFVRASGNTDLIVVETSKGVTPLRNKSDKHDGTEEKTYHEQYDPHVWLSLKDSQIQVTNIRDALIRADPANRAVYERNCADYISKLDALFNKYSEKFVVSGKKSFVPGHAAFGYLCRDFGLSQNSVEDVFAEGEPSAQQLAALVEYCRENKVTVVFAEELASPEISRTLADEVGAQVKRIYTIGSAEDGKTYLQRMEENLELIYESLK
jgi:zinc transport system substrate-binding protein